MKKLILFTILAGLMTSPVLAVATLALGGNWNIGDPGTTHQCWDFDSSDVGASGGGFVAAPNQDDLINPIPNQVLATITGSNLAYNDTDGLFTGETIRVELYIPNYENPNGYKEIWIDFGPTTTYDPDSLVIAAYDGGVLDFDYYELQGQGGAIFGIKIVPNPRAEKIDFTITSPTGGLATLDHLCVDTICIPAPGAVVLGSIGVALVGWLKRRRTL